MTRHLVKWKPIKCKDVRGSDIDLDIASSIDIRYQGALLSCIVAMPKRHPISFADAIRLLSDKQTEAFDARLFGVQPGEYSWYGDHFVEWISSLGFHIELTGDEFESYTLSDKVA